jgi:hypothetical protein
LLRKGCDGEGDGMSDSDDNAEIADLKAQLRSSIDRAEAALDQAMSLKWAAARRIEQIEEERQRLLMQNWLTDDCATQTVN